MARKTSDHDAKAQADDGEEQVLNSSDLDPNQGLTEQQKVQLAEQHPRPEDWDDEHAPAAVDRRPEAGTHPLPEGHIGEAPNQPGVLTPDQAGNPPA